MLRGIRGATTALSNTKAEILMKTKELLLEMIQKNSLKKERIASVFFTLSDDLNAEFPAVAARQLGWTEVPLLCAREINVPNSMRQCIRILIHYNVEDDKQKIKHVYLHDAKSLREDLD
ncbi:MAG: chorismate mutase [Candidatus Margulisbacteria bacterium]|nr:chorismate mutase [Candidatus Margulisiibacteriota bacterium]